MAKISGILKDGAGQIINDCTIELYAKKTTNNVLVQTQAFAVASDGKYSINAQPCEYDVSLMVNGFPKKRLGTINVYSDSVDGTLNDYLINPEASDLTPEFLKQVFDARDVAKKSATQATNSATEAKTSETNAKSFADEAKTSADNADNNAQIAVKSAVTATEAASTAVTSSDTAKSYADNARDSATASSQSATNSANSAIAAKTSETNANNSANNAKTSEDNAKKWASTVDNSNFVKKSGDETQRIDGQLDVNKLTENGKSVITDLTEVDNKIELIKTKIGDFRLMPFRRDELPFGWYFRNGDNFLLDSPQGQALNRLSDNYKRDHQITIKTINGQQYINVPSAFAPDGRGYFERAVNGTTRQVGSTEGDAIRNIKGGLPSGNSKALLGHEKIEPGDKNGAISIQSAGDDYLAGSSSSRKLRWMFFDFDASLVVPTSNENRPLNIGLTPAIYLGV